MLLNHSVNDTDSNLNIEFINIYWSLSKNIEDVLIFRRHFLASVVGSLPRLHESCMLSLVINEHI